MLEYIRSPTAPQVQVQTSMHDLANTTADVLYEHIPIATLQKI